MQKEEFKILIQSLQSLRLHGLWPKKGRAFDDTNYYYIRYFLIVLGCSLFWLGPLLHIIMVKKDGLSIDLSDDFAIISAIIGLHIITLTFVWNVRKTAKLYQQLSSFEYFGKPPNFEKLNRRLDLYSKILSYYCLIGIMLYAVLAAIDAPNCHRINEENNFNAVCGFVVSVWSPLNIDFFPVKQIAFAIQVIAMVTVMKGASTVSFSLYEVTQHLVLRIKHLNELLGTAFDHPDDKVKKKRFIHCIKYHSHIIEMYELFDRCYKHGNGCYILMTGIIFACIAKQFVQKLSLGPLLHLGGWIFSLYIRCHAGQSILSESLTIGPAAFDSRWYQAPVALQKDISFLILRSQKPFCHTAIPIGIMTLSLFINLVKTSYSYFTLMTQTM